MLKKQAVDLGRPRGLEKSSSFQYNILMNRNCTNKQIPVVEPGTNNNISSAAIVPVKEPMNDAIVIAVDGSSYAEPLWLNDPGKGSRMARTIYEILDSLSRQNHTFYLHFLSTREPGLLDPSRFNSPASLEQFIRQRRKDLKLPLRGNFLAPVVLWWQTGSSFSQKHLIVISNGPVYDFKDTDLNSIFYEYTWFCFREACPKYRPDTAIFAFGDQEPFREKVPL